MTTKETQTKKQKDSTMYLLNESLAHAIQAERQLEARQQRQRALYRSPLRLRLRGLRPRTRPEVTRSPVGLPTVAAG